MIGSNQIGVVRGVFEAVWPLINDALQRVDAALSVLSGIAFLPPLGLLAMLVGPLSDNFLQTVIERADGGIHVGVELVEFPVLSFG